MDASLSRLFRRIGVELMESEELTSKILLENVLECTKFVVNEVTTNQQDVGGAR